MALIDKASLLMVPSTYEAGKLYNVLPSGNRAPDSTDQNSGYDQTRADFDFDRGTDHAATRVNADGLIEKYRENVALHSNDFNNAYWITGAGTKPTTTKDQTDPFGNSNNAWTITGAGTTYSRLMLPSQVISTTITTLSFFVKQGTANEITIWTAQSSVASLTYNFDTQVVSGINGVYNVIRKVDDIGNGWYRIAMSLNRSSGTSSETWGLKFDGSSDSLILYGAQQETGLVATDYLDSTDVTGKAGVLVDMPRINFDANGENGSLLLEPSRQNLIPQTEYFGGWTLNGGGTGSNPVLDFGHTSPEGVDNAYKVTFDTGTGTTSSNESVMYISKSGLTIGNEYTASVYLKGAVGGEEVIVRDTAGDYVKWTLTNEWARYEMTQTAVGNSYATSFGVRQGLSGIGTINSDAVVYMYGFQSEAGSYPTSLIPNHGTSGGVTRAADSCNNGGSAESINSTEGVLYAEISALVNGGENRVMSISDGSYQNSVRIQLYTNTNEIEMRIVTANAVQALQRVAITNTLKFNKIAVKYKANDFQLWVNGSKLRFDTNGTMPAANTFDTFNFDDGDGNSDFYGNVKQVAVFNEALSDSELATLTTL